MFDKLLKVGENNVDAAVRTIWRIENIYIRREAQVEVLYRTSLTAVKNGKIDFLFRSRGSQLVWRAIKHFKEVTNAQWITFPKDEEQCKKLSVKLFGCDWEYAGNHDYVKKDDGKVYYYRAPFLGRDGFLGANGMVFHSEEGLKGNLYPKECPNSKLEYNARYNYSFECWDHPGYPKWKDVDVLWLFREPKYQRQRADSQAYIEWDSFGPVDFKPAGFSDADLLLLIDYVRRYLLSDLRKGVMLKDRSVQKTQFASKIDVPMEPSAHTKAILKATGQKIGVKIQSVGSNAAEDPSSRKVGSSKISTGTKETSVKESEETTSNDKPEKDAISNEKAPATKEKKRWKFVLIGLMFGWLGLHFVYAKRWLLFVLLWSGLISSFVFMSGTPESDTQVSAIEQKTDSAESKDSKSRSNGLFAGAGVAVWFILWIGGALFCKKDGTGKRM